jgi:PAS domain S-box-containing protein
MTPVLVVDDSLTVRMDLEEAFAGAGFEPTLAADLASAREMLARRRFALVVLDVLLPDGDGLALLAELKRSPEHAQTPVVLLSTEAEVQHRVRGLQTGADEYVGKPYDPAYVVARARDLVRRREPAGAAPRPPVLVVDDSLTAREALRADLERAGLDVVTAATGEEGLRVAADRRPSAIVVDGLMEGLDGAAFVRQLRADAALRTTPCILLTASGTVGELGALEAGADAYLRKEDGHAVVLARLQALLRASSAPPAQAAGGLLAPKRLLAVVGEAPLADVSARLRQDGHEVVAAATVDDALQLLAVDRGVDAILVDATGSPGLAFEACRRVRAEPRWRALPLVVIGAAGEDEASLVAIDAGADDYVSTGGGLEVVRARVRAQLRRKAFEDENRSREAYARSAAILETISDAFFAVDRAWRFVYVNHALEEVVGAGRRALVGETLWARCSWLGGSAAEALRGAASSGAPATFEAQAPGERWLEVRAFPHREGLTAYLRDVSERRRSQEVQAHFLGIVGHDLRTPLTAVSASVGMVLRDEALPEKHRRALQRVAGASSRMSRLISDLLDYSRARLGEGIPIALRPAHLDAICQEVLEELATVYPGRRIAYRHEGDGLGVWDPDRVQQVLLNLLTNALRHGPDDGEVALSWRGSAEEKVIAVHNVGPPIDAQLQRHIFHPFKRGDASGNAWGGVGLGLYIVEQIVAAHGGSVALRSDEASGTTFTVRLPAQVRPAA